MTGGVFGDLPEEMKLTSTTPWVAPKRGRYQLDMVNKLFNPGLHAVHRIEKVFARLPEKQRRMNGGRHYCNQPAHADATATE